MGGFFPFPKQTIYGASKAALKLFTEGLYSELIDTNIKVMIVLPGAINTDIAKNSNVDINNARNYKMTSAKKAAKLIINGIKRNKFKLYIGNDSKIMNLLYNFNSRLAIKTISKKMKGL
jgi:short-subunit dehydrogenase